MSGTPTLDERAYFTIEITDQNQSTDTQRYVLVIGNPTGVDDEFVSDLPKEFKLFQDYPNPFNATTTINYQLPIRSQVKLEVYNLLGQRIETLVDERQEAGYRSVSWRASEVGSGIYFMRLEAGDKSLARKMLLVK